MSSIAQRGGEPDREEVIMRHALLRHLQLGPIRDMDWVTAKFGHR